jgi:hypothetical protein
VSGATCGVKSQGSIDLIEIQSAKLTTCDVTDDGKIVRLNLVDVAGNSVSLRLPFEHAGALAMTLPGLLTQALKASRQDGSARYIFPLDDWLLEAVAGCRALIVTLKTTDGFEVSFAAPLDTCRSLASALRRQATNVAKMVSASPN